VLGSVNSVVICPVVMAKCKKEVQAKQAVWRDDRADFRKKRITYMFRHRRAILEEFFLRTKGYKSNTRN
jgi:hypothetical protein